MAKKRKKGKFGCFENETNVSSSFEHVLLGVHCDTVQEQGEDGGHGYLWTTVHTKRCF